MSTFLQRARSADHKSNCVVFGFIKQMHPLYHVIPQLTNYIVLCCYYDPYQLIRVKNCFYEDAEMIFQINGETTKLEKLMDVYCNRIGRDRGMLRFLYLGGRLDPNKTFKEFIDEGWWKKMWWKEMVDDEEEIDVGHECSTDDLPPVITNPSWRKEIIKI